MAVRIGDKVAYHTASGDLKTGTVTRKTGQGMVDIRLAGSDQVVRQAASSLSRLRTNGRRSQTRYRRNPEQETRWIMPLAAMIQSGERTGDDAVDAVIDTEAERIGDTQDFDAVLAAVQKKEKSLKTSLLSAEPLLQSDAELFDYLRGNLPPTVSRQVEIYTSRSAGTKARVDISVGRSGALDSHALKQFRMEQRREKRYVKDEALKAARKYTDGEGIFESIQKQSAAVRILPDPVRTDRAETFVCGNVLDGHAYVLNTLAQPRTVSHWITYGDLGLEMREGVLAFDSKKATYMVRVGNNNPVPLTLENLLQIEDISKAAIFPREGSKKEQARTFLQKIGGKENLRPFDVVPLALGGEINPVLARARNEGESSDIAQPQNNEALQSFVQELARNTILRAPGVVPSGYDASNAALVGITNVGSAWVKSKGSKSGVYDKTGALRSSKIQGGMAGGLYPKAALPSELPSVRVQGAGFSVPDNRIRPETPVLFSVPERPISQDEGDKYALDMDRANVFRESELVGIRTLKMKDVTRQTIRESFQVFAPNSPKDRNPYYSWVPERPGQFPDVSKKDAKQKVDVFDRYCPEPKQLEYLEAVKQVSFALGNVLSAAHGVRSDMKSDADVGPPGSPNQAQVSTIYYAGGEQRAEQVAARQRGFLEKKVLNLRYALSRLSVQYDRIEAKTQIRPFRGRPAADYTIFENTGALDFLLPSDDAKEFVHITLARMKREVKNLIDSAVTNKVLVAEKRESRKRRGKSKARETYTIRTFKTDFKPFSAVNLAEYAGHFGELYGWSERNTQAVARLLSSDGAVTWLNITPQHLSTVEKALVSLQLANYKEFFRGIRERLAPSYAKTLERAMLLTTMTSNRGRRTFQTNGRVKSYGHLFVAMLGLSAYRPDSLGDKKVEAQITAQYQLSFTKIVRELCYFTKNAEAATAIEKILDGRSSLGGVADDAQYARETLGEVLAVGKEAILMMPFSPAYRDSCLNLLDYLHLRANQNLLLLGWNGGSNFVFTEAMAMYLALGLDSPSIVGPFIDEDRYIGGHQSVEVILRKMIREKLNNNPDAAGVLTLAWRDLKYEAGLKGRTLDRLGSLNEAEVRELARALNRAGVPNEAKKLKELWLALADESAESDLDPSTDNLKILARQLNETLKIAIAGGHGIEDASRIRTAGQKPIRVNGYYTYNPLLFTLTKDEYKIVASKKYGGHVPFKGFYHYDEKQDKAVWKHRDLAESIDKIGFYGMLLYWTRTAALQYEGPVTSADALQEAWNQYWDRFVEETGEDALILAQIGKKEVKPKDFSGNSVDLPAQFFEFSPRSYQETRTNEKTNGRYILAAHIYAQSRADLFGIIQKVKDAIYETRVLKAASFTGEGFYPKGSVGGVGGAEQKEIQARTEAREKSGSKTAYQGWVSKLGSVLSQMQLVLAEKAIQRPTPAQRKAQTWLRDSHDKWLTANKVGTDSPEYVAQAAQRAATILGVPGFDGSQDIRKVAPEILGPLVEALYAARTKAAVPPAGTSLRPWQATATDKSYINDTHIAIAQRRREFQQKLLRLIDDRIKSISSAG